MLHHQLVNHQVCEDPLLLGCSAAAAAAASGCCCAVIKQLI
jgi:hypothetical protein